ncbi:MULTISPECIES: DUF1795 domain-containing protein [unclassified Pseudomonas]|uniref:DUF1795 domain-containing protein n=1 Tax=unclassified Pseudomonas TaxID=196821 RepID=UPI0030DB46FB
MDYPLPEGRINLPQGFEDRSVNMFILGSSIPAPLSITLSRDNTLPGEELNTYFERQIKLISAKYKGYTVLGRSAAVLSQAHPLPGLQVDAYYFNDRQAFFQRQAAFEVQPGRVLVFSTTRPGEFSAQQNTDWLTLLNSFVPEPGLTTTTSEQE